MDHRPRRLQQLQHIPYLAPKQGLQEGLLRSRHHPHLHRSRHTHIVDRI